MRVCMCVSGARARTSKAGGEGRERSARVWPAEANERVSHQGSGVARPGRTDANVASTPRFDDTATPTNEDVV